MCQQEILLGYIYTVYVIVTFYLFPEYVFSRRAGERLVIIFSHSHRSLHFVHVCPPRTSVRGEILLWLRDSWVCADTCRRPVSADLHVVYLKGNTRVYRDIVERLGRCLAQRKVVRRYSTGPEFCRFHRGGED